MDIKILLYEEIRNGTEQNPIRSAYLEEKYNISGSKVREVVREIRRDPHLALIGARSSDKTMQGGYYIVKSLKSYENARNNLQNRINSMLKTLSIMDRKAQKQMEKGQMELL